MKQHHALAGSGMGALLQNSIRRRAWLLITALTASACLGEVTVPDCVRDHSCGEGGDDSGAGARPSSGGTAGMSDAGSSSPSAGRGRQDGGEGGSTMSGGAGAAGIDGAGAGGGETDLGPECDSCLIREEYLDSPCAGSSYAAQLTVQDGEPPFSWQVSASRPGWAITATGPDQAKLTNPAVATGNTRLTITATSRSGEHTTKVFDVVARDSCFFAFTQLGDNGAGELLLFDPIASSPEAVELAHNTGVFDFAFSPDGRYLAYSYGADEDSPRGAHLALVNLRTLEDAPLSFGEDAISAFAWSPDSKTLAASYRSGEQSFLGAVRLPDAGPGAPKTTLAPTPAFAATELHWLGNRAVAYHAPVYPDLAHPGTFVGGAENPSGLRAAFWAELGPSGFDAQQYGLETFPPDVTLRAAPDGFFMVADTPPWTIFYAAFRAPPYAATRARISLLSPSGLYAARFDQESGQRLRIDSATGALGESLAISEEECPLLLGWAPDSERVACVTDAWNDDGKTQHGELRLFTLDEVAGTMSTETVAGFCTDDVSTLEPASCAVHLDQYAYGTDLARGMARSFSTSGRRFAFTSAFEDEAFLYLAELNDGPAALGRALYFAQPGQTDLPTRLGFSPDDRSLLLQLGTELTLVNVVTGEARGGLTAKLGPANNCSEDFSAEPDAYCGNTERSAPWVWSPDSKRLAYQTVGGLSVVDISSPFGIEQLAIRVSACGSACSGHFAFQPSPP